MREKVEPFILGLTGAVWMAMVVMSSSAIAEDGYGTWHPVENHPDCKFLNLLHQKAWTTQWTGNCENGLVQGKGTISYETETGEVHLSGIFEEGILNGHGKLNSWSIHRGKPRQSQYTGMFKNGLMDGYGELKFIGFGVYTGEFQNGMFNGHGVLTMGGNTRLEGTYKDGELNGPGILDVTGDGAYHYEGEFKGTDKHGHGVMVFPNGVRYEGEFNDGWRHGHGMFSLQNGDTCEGEWKKGRLTGVGKGRLDGETVPCVEIEHETFTFITDR